MAQVPQMPQPPVAVLDAVAPVDEPPPAVGPGEDPAPANAQAVNPPPLTPEQRLEVFNYVLPDTRVLSCGF